MRLGTCSTARPSARRDSAPAPKPTAIGSVPIKAAIAASLISVIATASASATVHLARGLVNIRLAVVLEVATTAGGLFGGFFGHRQRLFDRGGREHGRLGRAEGALLVSLYGAYVAAAIAVT